MIHSTTDFDLDAYVGRYLLASDERRAAARKVDDTIRKLPGSGTVQFLEAWMDRFARPTQGGA